MLKNQSSINDTVTSYTCIDSFQSYFVFEKHSPTSGSNFNPKSSQKWPESAKYEKL